MVRLTVKGTKYPDEFCVERTLLDDVSPQSSLVQTICHIQNMRHQVKLILLSANELVHYNEQKPEKSLNTCVEGDKTEIDDHGNADINLENKTNHNSSSKIFNRNQLKEDFLRLIENTYIKLKDKSQLVTDDEYDLTANELRRMTMELFSHLCTDSEGEQTVIDKLYKAHEDPDIDEDMRLQIYHCRAILDKEWKRNEWECEEKAAFWFCNKIMRGPLSNYCGKNERSRVTIKIHPCDGTPPAAEPRISYDDQRALFTKIQTHKEEIRNLEESELREMVRQKSRPALLLPTDEYINSQQIQASISKVTSSKQMSKSEKLV